MTTNTATINRTTVEQIGRMNVLAISGGRIKAITETTIELPVHAGYHVRIEYVRGSDTYTVTRLFRRGAKEWVKGQATNVYNTELGEIAYRASCYLDEFNA